MMYLFKQSLWPSCKIVETSSCACGAVADHTGTCSRQAQEQLCVAQPRPAHAESVHILTAAPSHSYVNGTACSISQHKECLQFIEHPSYGCVGNMQRTHPHTSSQSCSCKHKRTAHGVHCRQQGVQPCLLLIGPSKHC